MNLWWEKRHYRTTHEMNQAAADFITDGYELSEYAPDIKEQLWAMREELA